MESLLHKPSTDFAGRTPSPRIFCVIQVLLGHAKLDTTALYAKVAVRTVRAVVSPLDRLALVPREEASPG